INASPAENVEAVAEAKGIEPTDVSVVVLERDRHEDLIRELREAGAKVNLIRDGDVAPAIAAARGGTGVDLLMGIGGTPEGVISAAAIKCLGGALQGRLWPRSDDERRQLADAGYDVERVLTTDDPGARGAVHLRAVVVRPLRRFDVLLLAAPCLERRRLQRTAVRERQLPRMRPHRVHRVEVRGRVLVRLSAGQEHDPGHGAGDVTLEAADRLLRDLLVRRLLGVVVAG